MKIGMIVAMEREIESAISAFGSPLRTESVCGMNISVYKIADSEIYLTRSGAGEIYAAGAAQLLITRYSVDAIVNYGIVGGLTEEMTLCRTVAVDKVVHYDFDTSPVDGCGPARYINYPSIYLETDKTLLNRALAAVPGLKKVICASGDKFVADPEKKRELHEKYGADICEMESAGIFLTADRAGVPVLMIKSVSDSLFGGAAEAEKNVEEAASECVRALMAVLEA